MGVSLRILPQYNVGADFSHDFISLDRDPDMFDIITNLEQKVGRKVPRKGIYSFTGNNDTYEADCYGRTIKTPYGYVMNGVLAGELKYVLSDYATESWKNRAFIAFVNELPDDLEIWLYWH